MRVLRIIARLNVGGPAIHTVLLSSELDEERFETRLLAGSVGPHEGDMSWYAREHGVDPVFISALGREIDPYSDLRALRKILRHMRELKPHIVHTHTAKAGALGRVAAWMYNNGRRRGAPRAKVVHTFHGHVLHSYFGGMRTGMFRSIERRLARRTDRLVALSTELKRELLFDYRIGEPWQWVVIPLGLDLEPFAQITARVGTFREELGLADDTVLVSIVGRLVPVKNHDMLISAAVRLQRRSHTRVAFAVVGDGELRETLERRVGYVGLEDQFHFVGWRQDLVPIYADSDIVALTSRNEGTPVSLIEAMASGRVVVATDVGGVRDVVTDGETGILIAPHREDRLAIALGQLADLPEERERMGRAARESALERFRKERLINDIESLYLDLAGTS